MEKITLYEEYRLIERSESEVNSTWKGAHLLIFFLAFVFGSFCTFCFHMLMYVFDDKCVLYPRLLSGSSAHNKIFYDFITEEQQQNDKSMPVDFVSTQWTDKSACYVPLYVPLVSAIFGLVWTTMFLMFSSGSQSLTGLQRPWRILPLIFIFSLTMGITCIYASITTQNGLNALCSKLGEIAGSNSCSYTINVVTILTERRIRGVYQTIQLAITSAWLHTLCWLLAALLALMRVLLVVDFRLVRIKAELQGDVDKMLERYEKHIRTVSPDLTAKDNFTSTRTAMSSTSVKVHFTNKNFDSSSARNQIGDGMTEQFRDNDSSPTADRHSIFSLEPEEWYKIVKMSAYGSVPERHRFIVEMVYSIGESIGLDDIDASSVTSGDLYLSSEKTSYNGEHFSSLELERNSETLLPIFDITENISEGFQAKHVDKHRILDISQETIKQSEEMESTPTPSIPNTITNSPYESKLDIDSSQKDKARLENTKRTGLQSPESAKKSSLKSKRSEALSTNKKSPLHRVVISDKATKSAHGSDVTLKPDDENAKDKEDVETKDKNDGLGKNDTDETNRENQSQGEPLEGSGEQSRQFQDAETQTPGKEKID